MPGIDKLLERAFISRIITLEREQEELRVPAEGIVCLVSEEGDDPDLPLAERLRRAHSRLQALLAKARQS